MVRYFCSRLKIETLDRLQRNEMYLIYGANPSPLFFTISNHQFETSHRGFNDRVMTLRDYKESLQMMNLALQK